MLLKDERITELHMTGALATYNAMMWGNGAPGVGKPLVEKPFTAELGCVTPAIIVPTHKKWSKRELDAAAMNVVAGIVCNTGHSCNATEIVVTARKWPQRGAFLNAVRDVLNACHQRWPWYPGSRVRSDAPWLCCTATPHPLG